jgi:hypothetical protein
MSTSIVRFQLRIGQIAVSTWSGHRVPLGGCMWRRFKVVDMDGQRVDKVMVGEA